MDAFTPAAPARPPVAAAARSVLEPALLLRPRGVGALLDSAVALYRRNFFLYVGIVALMQVPVSLVLTLANIVLLDPSTLQAQPRSPLFSSDPSPAALQSYNEAAAAWISDLLSRSLIILGIGVVGAVLINLATAALAWTIAEGYLGRTPTIRAAYQAARPRLGSLTGAILVVSLLSLLIFLPPLFLWIFISWTFVSQVIMLEGRTLSDALRRSWELVRGSWWRVFGAYVLLTLISFIITLPASLVTAGLGFVGANWAVQNVGSQFITLLFTVLFVPVRLAGMTLLYFDLRVRQEGFDLQMALDGRAAQLGLEPALQPGGWPYREQVTAPVAATAPRLDTPVDPYVEAATP